MKRRCNLRGGGGGGRKKKKKKTKKKREKGKKKSQGLPCSTQKKETTKNSTGEK